MKDSAREVKRRKGRGEAASQVGKHVAATLLRLWAMSGEIEGGALASRLMVSFHGGVVEWFPSCTCRTQVS